MMTLQEISDHIEIGQVMLRYVKAIDEKNYGLLRTCFTEDADLVYFLMGQRIAITMKEADGLYKVSLIKCFCTHHVVAPPLIELQGDKAHANSRVTATHVQMHEDGSKTIWKVQGFYEDELVRKPEGWRICKRVSNNPYEEGALLTEGVREFPEENRSWGDNI
jgi:hypothetical protein